MRSSLSSLVCLSVASFAKVFMTIILYSDRDIIPVNFLGTFGILLEVLKTLEL
jgi:hypothetical protein